MTFKKKPKPTEVTPQPADLAVVAAGPDHTNPVTDDMQLSYAEGWKLIDSRSDFEGTSYMSRCLGGQPPADALAWIVSQRQ